jgi:1-acyl-sn-glycerol-3-phosphate acyltransferase
VFVDRTRRTAVGRTANDILGRLGQGDTIVLFAEGTSSDGNRVLPFRSALIGAVREAGARTEHGITVQPMAISYTRVNGIAMGRMHRPLIAWYGDLDFMPHIKALLGAGAIDAVVNYGEPFTADARSDRKIMAKQLEDAVRRLNAATLHPKTAAGR